MVVLTNSDLTYEAVTAVYIASRGHANRWRGGSLWGETAPDGPSGLCGTRARTEAPPGAPRSGRSPRASVPVLTEHRTRSGPAPVPAGRAGWGICNARAGAAVME